MLGRSQLIPTRRLLWPIVRYAGTHAALVLLASSIGIQSLRVYESLRKDVDSSLAPLALALISSARLGENFRLTRFNDPVFTAEDDRKLAEEEGWDKVTERNDDNERFVAESVSKMAEINARKGALLEHFGHEDDVRDFVGELSLGNGVYIQVRFFDQEQAVAYGISDSWVNFVGNSANAYAIHFPNISLAVPSVTESLTYLVICGMAGWKWDTRVQTPETISSIVEITLGNMHILDNNGLIPGNPEAIVQIGARNGVFGTPPSIYNQLLIKLEESRMRIPGVELPFSPLDGSIVLLVIFLIQIARFGSQIGSIAPTKPSISEFELPFFLTVGIIFSTVGIIFVCPTVMFIWLAFYFFKLQLLWRLFLCIALFSCFLLIAQKSFVAYRLRVSRDLPESGGGRVTPSRLAF